MLRKLLDVRNLCEPIEVNGKPGYRFTAVGTFDRRLTGKMAMDNPANVFGGGQGTHCGCQSMLPFESHGVVVVA